MKLKFFLYCFLFFSTLNLEAQNININPYWQGEIKLNDGTVKKGYVQVPNNPSQVGVSYKESKDSKIERIKKKNIELVKVISESGKVYEFEPVAVVYEIKGNISWGKSMLLVSHKNDYVKFYISYGVYRVNKKGELFMLYSYTIGNDFPTLCYFIKKRGEEKCRLLHMTGLLRGFKKGANHYLTEDPVLLGRINDNELKFSDIDYILETYMDTTKNL